MLDIHVGSFTPARGSQPASFVHAARRAGCPKAHIQAEIGPGRVSKQLKLRWKVLS